MSIIILFVARILFDIYLIYKGAYVPSPKPPVKTLSDYQEYIELFKSKGMQACKEWPREYPSNSERPCYVYGVDKTIPPEPYCSVFLSDKQVHGDWKMVYLCDDFWEYFKKASDIVPGKPFEIEMPPAAI